MLLFGNAAGQHAARTNDICWACSSSIARRIEARLLQGHEFQRGVAGKAVLPEYTRRFQAAGDNPDALPRRKSIAGKNTALRSNRAGRRLAFQYLSRINPNVPNMRHFSTTRRINQPEAAKIPPTPHYAPLQQYRRAWNQTQSNAEPAQSSPIHQKLAAFQAAIDQPSPIRQKLADFQAAIDSASNEDKAALGKAFAQYTQGPLYSGKTNQQDDDLVNGIDEDRTSSSNDIITETNTKLSRFDSEPGDLLGFTQGEDCILTLMVNSFKSIDDVVASQIQLLNPNGTWIQYEKTRLGQLTWRIPKFVDLKELEGIRSHLPDKHIPQKELETPNPLGWYLPREISLPITEKLSDFKKRVDTIWRENASRLDNAFQLVTKPAESAWWSVEDLTRTILQKSKTDELSEAEKYVVHRACMAYNVGFHPDHCHAESHLFEVHSRKDAELVEQVRRWVRNHRETVVQELGNKKTEGSSRSILQNFADEVRPIILESRKNRPLLSDYIFRSSKEQPDNLQDSGLAYKIIEGPKISPSTSTILKFLEMSAGRRQALAHAGPVATLSTAIVRSTDLYGESESHIPGLVGTSLLKECGVVAPWHCMGDVNITLLDPYSKANSYFADNVRGAQQEANSGKFEVDVMKNHRRDFGDMPIFCIDSASTVDVDDGISVEACSEADTYWVHAHIANPTAFIPLDSHTHDFARKMHATAYMVDRTNRMLPVDSITRQFSLKRNSPTLTISTKINEDGMILDHKIQNGYIRNVHHVTPEIVKRSLGIPTPEICYKSWIIGKLPPQGTTHHEPTALMQESIEALQTMARLGTAWEKKIEKASGRDWNLTQARFADPHVHHTKVEEPVFENFRQHIGDPTLTYRSGNFLDQQFCNGSDQGIAGRIVRGPTRDIVSNMMLLANHSAAQWCHKRGIPNMFRGATSKGTEALERTQDLVKRLDQPVTDLGQWSTDVNEMQILMKPRASFRSTRLARHDALSMDGYMTVTSPLRRYTDMFSHYQIESALRAEAKLRRPFEGTDVIDLAFSEDMVKKAIDFSAWRDVMALQRADSNMSGWESYVWLRGGLLREVKDFPEYLTGYILGGSGDIGNRVVLKEFGTRRGLAKKWQPRFDELKAGQAWKIEFVPSFDWRGVSLMATERIG